jgi:AMP deaminase
MYSNIYTLNKLREAKGLNTFPFRPHCGESGAKEHLLDTFLLAQSINHGINLSKYPVLQYLFYLEKIGLSVSPLSNNYLFLSYNDNPFYTFFKRGLNVTLSTGKIMK